MYIVLLILTPISSLPWKPLRFRDVTSWNNSGECKSWLPCIVLKHYFLWKFSSGDWGYLLFEFRRMWSSIYCLWNFGILFYIHVLNLAYIMSMFKDMDFPSHSGAWGKIVECFHPYLINNFVIYVTRFQFYSGRRCLFDKLWLKFLCAFCLFCAILQLLLLSWPCIDFGFGNLTGFSKRWMSRLQLSYYIVFPFYWRYIFGYFV